MTNKAFGNPTRALAGLGALAVYILACTSFSPDDSKVLYPTIDPQTGDIGVAVYDRKSRTSELLFVPKFENGTRAVAEEGVPIRPQWLPDGRSIAVAWSGKDDRGHQVDNRLNVAVLPFERKGPIRLYQLEGVNDEFSLAYPLPIAGNFLFVNGQSNQVLRLNLSNGQARRETLPPDITLLASPRADVIFFVQETKDTPIEDLQLGVINPDTFARTTILGSMTNIAGPNAEGFVALGSNGKSLARLAKKEKQWLIHLLEAGQPARTLSLPLMSDSSKFGNTLFSPKGDVLYQAFMNVTSNPPNTSFGFLEVPLDGQPVKETVLLKSSYSHDESDAFLFPIEVSHDGKTLAAVSTYLALKHELPAEDRGLFLVDLTHPRRPVTKVPVPAPPAK